MIGSIQTAYAGYRGYSVYPMGMRQATLAPVEPVPKVNTVQGGQRGQLLVRPEQSQNAQNTAQFAQPQMPAVREGVDAAEMAVRGRIQYLDPAQVSNLAPANQNRSASSFLPSAGNASQTGYAQNMGNMARSVYAPYGANAAAFMSLPGFRDGTMPAAMTGAAAPAMPGAANTPSAQEGGAANFFPDRSGMTGGAAAAGLPGGNLPGVKAENGDNAAARAANAEETQSPAEVMKEAECQTCKERKYQDGSDDPGVSFKTPTQLSPEQAATAVRGHEMEHVTREQAKADREDRRVLSQSVSIHTAICPECGRVYISGGTTRTVTAAKPEQQSAKPDAEAQNAAFGIMA